MNCDSRLPLVILAICLPLRAAPEEKEFWKLTADPASGPAVGEPRYPRGAIPLAAGIPRVEFAPAPCPFVAVSPGAKRVPGQPLAGDRVQVYDLRTLKPLGPAFAAPTDFGDPHVVAPDGLHLAARARGAHGTVEVWSAKTGQSVRRIDVDTDPNRFAFPVEFIRNDRLLTMCHDARAPDPGQKTVYQVWDITAGKELTRFEADIVYHWKWGAVSPGGRYLAVEKTETLSGYQLLAWDLTTGEQVGEVEFQPKAEAWGQAAGMAFSPDGKELAVLWRLGKAPDQWGRVRVFEVATGRKVADHALGYALKNMDVTLGMGGGGGRAFQWLPDGSGWLVQGHLLVGRRTGAVIGKLGNEPRLHSDVQPRRVLGSHVTAVTGGGFDKQLTFEPLPRGK
jgi:hypothetical protein